MTKNQSLEKDGKQWGKCMVHYISYISVNVFKKAYSHCFEPHMLRVLWPSLSANTKYQLQFLTLPPLTLQKLSLLATRNKKPHH